MDDLKSRAYTTYCTQGWVLRAIQLLNLVLEPKAVITHRHIRVSPTAISLEVDGLYFEVLNYEVEHGIIRLIRTCPCGHNTTSDMIRSLTDLGEALCGPPVKCSQWLCPTWNSFWARLRPRKRDRMDPEQLILPIPSQQ